MDFRTTRFWHGFEGGIQLYQRRCRAFKEVWRASGLFGKANEQVKADQVNDDQTLWCTYS